MDVVGVIPVRWQSSRFPGKPLADLLGKSLIRRTYENAKRCKRLDAVLIATDDQRIFNHVKDFGAEVVMTSVSCPTGTDRVNEAINQHVPKAKVVVNIQGDEPCLEPTVIDTLVDKLKATPHAVITTPVAQIHDSKEIFSPSSVKCVFDRNGRALYFSRAPVPFAQKNVKTNTYFRHLGIYCFRRDFLTQYAQLEKTPLQECEDLEQLKILESGYPIHVCVVEDQAIGVDTPEDLTHLRQFLCQNENTFSSPEALSPR